MLNCSAQESAIAEITKLMPLHLHAFITSRTTRCIDNMAVKVVMLMMQDAGPCNENILRPLWEHEERSDQGGG